MAKKPKIYTMAPYIKSVLKFLALRQNQFFARGGKREKEISFGTTVKRIGLIREEVNKKLRPKEPFQPKSLERIFQYLKREDFLKLAKGEKEKFVVSVSAYKFLGIERIISGKKIPPSSSKREAKLEGRSPEEEKKEKVAPKKVVKEYQPKEIYEKGDIIYHKVWQEEGEVIEKGVTADGRKMIIVSFPRAGRKRLIMGYPALRV